MPLIGPHDALRASVASRRGSRPAPTLDSLPRHARPRMDPSSHLPESPSLNVERHDSAARSATRTPLRDHVANSVRRYLGDLNGSDANNLYEVALRELEIPLFAEVLKHCDGNQSRAATMLGIHRATLRKKLKDYGLST